MKSLPVFAFLCFQSLAYSQIHFQEISSPVDFSLSEVRKSPIGEYFVQALSDYNNIYTSMNGQDWTKKSLPISLHMNEIQFFSDGTPLLKNDYNEHLIRRNGSWYTMNATGGYEDVKASFIKDDTLFVFQEDAFAYSLDKGQSFTSVFIFGEYIVDHTAHLWKFDHHLILHHTAGSYDYLSIFTEDGERIRFEILDVGVTDFTYNSCGQILINDRDHYYLLKEQGLDFITGSTSNIIPDFSSSSFLSSQGGHYFRKVGNTIYKTAGCNFIWDTLVSNDLISPIINVWISPQEEVLLYSKYSDLFIESNGSNTWEEHSLNINYPHISTVIESTHKHQMALTKNALFSKGINDVNWTELDTTGGQQIQYSPDGDLYVNRERYILYSADNGISFSTILVPEGQFPNTSYSLEVLGNNILFIIGGVLGGSYYTVDNGQNWIPAVGSFTLEIPQVKLVDNYIMIAELDFQYLVTIIDITSDKRTTEQLGDFFQLDYYGSAIQDDGTIYFHGFDASGEHPDGLYRYRFGEGVEFIGQFEELIYLTLLAASGTDLYGFKVNEYYLLEGDVMTAHSYVGLPVSGYKIFLISENEYLYVIIDNQRIFRSTKPLSYSQFIRGSVYNHVSQDCALDTLDGTLQYWQVKIESDEYLRIKTTDNEGNFSFSVPSGQYKLSSQPLNTNWDLCESSFNITIDENNPNANQNFIARGLTECAELEIDFSTPLLRRCFDNYYSIRIRNTGPEATEGTTLTLELDPFFDFISATIPYTLVGDSILKFDLGILAVNDEISFQIFFNLSCDAEIGTEHCLSGFLEDVNECGDERSSYIECQQNIGSFDPNDKRVFNEEGKEAETVDKDEYIYYHIRFQNTGTDTAFNIKIVDPLSPQLDLATLEMLSASHPYTFVITDGPALKVDFNHVLLPDSSTNEPASHGFFKFRIKPLPQFDYGTNIPNQAGIYFDFNDPVLTNETTVIIQLPVRTKEPKDFIDFIIYPSPVNDILSLTISESDLNRIDAYEIIDQLGHKVNQSGFLNSNAVNVSDLAPGVYNLMLKEHGMIIGMKKFVKL